MSKTTAKCCRTVALSSNELNQANMSNTAAKGLNKAKSSVKAMRIFPVAKS